MHTLSGTSWKRFSIENTCIVVWNPPKQLNERNETVYITLTPSLHLVLFCQLHTSQNLLSAHQFIHMQCMNVVYTLNFLTYLSCTSTCTADSTLLIAHPQTYKTNHICHVQQKWNGTDNSFSMHNNMYYRISTAHFAVFHIWNTPPVHSSNKHMEWLAKYHKV